MKTDYYLGHKFDWTQKFIEALPKKRSLSFAKAICMAEMLQHKYTLTKKREVFLDHKTLRLFGITRKNLEKYLPYFEQKNLIKWIRKKGMAWKIVLLELPTNYVHNKYVEIKENKEIKETSTPGGKVTSTPGSEVTSTPGSKVEKLVLPRQGTKTRPLPKTSNQDKQPRQVTKTGNQDKEPRQGRKS